jgi:hypothetical protein
MIEAAATKPFEPERAWLRPVAVVAFSLSGLAVALGLIAFFTGHRSLAIGFALALNTFGLVADLAQRTYARRNKIFLKSEAGILYSDGAGRRRLLSWDDVDEFSVRGQMAPHGVAVLRNGKLVHLPLGDGSFSRRAHPPTPELSQTMETLEQERRRRTGTGTPDTTSS